ncbi:NAD(P)/FAD-dependent oxidoreductase [Labrys wisconsinensis]|uniref:Glycine/D-amino acid oxidase-like deaminating enzyme n=1 Tax=Labrys wisconsinensis TaxID=425677 RepID=A0ABU0JDY4_9HYPH|nr:FAD-dependent oxidoreductase [Labrys wisconsinensis]MDQ0471825.1 glycine/D-amino acid oxidase-like deaminating enzyme [Labrys wisconsinensis]
MTRSTADVIVIGGGIVGMSAAYFLQRAGLAVTVVEREHLAFGASGRNAGFIWLSLRTPGPQLDLARAGLALYPGIVDDIGDSFEFRQHGGMIYAFNDGQMQVLKELAAARQADGVRMRAVDGQEARALCPILPDSVVGATFCEEDAQLHTPKFVEALGAAFASRGGTIRPGTAVTAVRREGGRVIGVDTSAGPIDAETVVVATGAWTAPFLADLDIALPVRPMRLQAMSTVPIAERFRPVLYGPLALKQYTLIRDLPSYRDDLFRSPSEASLTNVELLECFCQRQDSTVLMGCAMDYPGYVDTSTLEGVGITGKVFAEHIPKLRDVALDRAWACMLPSTPDSLPYIGRPAGLDGLVIAAGHVFGNAAGPITGRLVEGLVTGAEPPLDMAPFEVSRHADLAVDGAVRW